MAKYMIHLFCNECSGVHPMGIVVQNNKVLEKMERINDVYDGEPLPPELAVLLRNSIICPETGKKTTQTDNNEVYLVPISNESIKDC